jgi:hypothetical protein
MEPNVKSPKKKAKKAAAEAQPAAPAAKIVQPDNYPSWRDEEDLIDYETEEPARFSPVEMDNSAEKNGYPAHGDGPEDKVPVNDDFPLIRRRLQTWRGGSAAEMFLRGRATPQVQQERRRRKLPTRRK